MSVIFLQYGAQLSYADITPNPTTLPAFLVRECGYSEDPNANKCCSKLDFEKTVAGPARFVFRAALPDLLANAAVDVVSKAYEYDPIHKKMEVSCYTGFEKKIDVKNSTTGKLEKACFCSDEAYQKKAVTSVAAQGSQIIKICNKYIDNKKEWNACRACAQREAFMTGLGCIPTNFSEFVTNFLLKTGIGFAGLFSLGCIIYSAIMIQTSQGNAEKISASQDQIKACIFGLLLVMFSILLLRIIGVDLLGLPSFG